MRSSLANHGRSHVSVYIKETCNQVWSIHFRYFPSLLYSGRPFKFLHLRQKKCRPKAAFLLAMGYEKDIPAFFAN